MAMLDWFQRLLPREEKFFPLFERHAASIAAAAAALRRMLDGGAEVRQHCRAVMQYEEEADAVTRDVLIGVRSTFITPFDRGDIKDLITAMDDAIDQMQKTAKAIVLFEMTAFAPQMRSIADAIGECSELVRRAMPLLANIGQHAGQLSEICQQIGRIEGRADEIYDQGLSQLYQRAKSGDTLEFLRCSQIYDHLEKSVDCFDDIANQVQGIVIEHI
jgi:predicted phosphate transport protein (TIGR00153 family)